MLSGAPQGPSVSEQVSGSQTTSEQLDSDALLQASRRVDWRFLLPDPNLDRVAYLGPKHGSLVDSLRVFAQRLTILDSTSHPAELQFDVAVAVRPDWETLRYASTLILPGGFLYVEAAGPFKPKQGRGGRKLRFASEYVAALEDAGLVEAAAHWHWPNFEACAEIVPLGDPGALRLAFARRRSGTGARLKSALGRALLYSGLFARIAPHISIVARKPEQP